MDAMVGQRLPQLKMPRLDAYLVRDEKGFYRPAAGGLPLLHDQGDSMVLKSKGADAYRGAMELALAKGWTAIELKGKPAMLAEAWLEAKLVGLDVVNYSPSEKDKTRFAERLAEANKLKETEKKSQPMEQLPQFVEVRPVVVGGLTKMESMTYTVSYPGGKDAQFDNPKDAAQAFSGLAASLSPVVVRTVTRLDGLVNEGIVAGVGFKPTSASKESLSMISDPEFDTAMEEVIAAGKAVEASHPVPVALDGIQHSGTIRVIKDGWAGQQSGRDPGQLVWHEIAKLTGPALVLGQQADIVRAKGLGRVMDKALEREVDGGRER